MSALTDNRYLIPVCAARALRALGPEAKAAIPQDIYELLKKDDALERSMMGDIFKDILFDDELSTAENTGSRRAPRTS
jgi:hypothetical protein